MRGRFNVNRISSDEQAKEEMNYQYGKMMEAETTETRKTRFEHMLDIYDKFPIVRETWEYVKEALRYTAKFIKRITQQVVEAIENILHYHDYFYIMRFYDKDNKHVFDKIGTSVDVERRMKQHLNKYPSVDHGKILYTIDTHKVDATSLESVARNYLVKKYTLKNFISKDRFKVKIDVQDLAEKLPNSLAILEQAELT